MVITLTLKAIEANNNILRVSGEKGLPFAIDCLKEISDDKILKVSYRTLKERMKTRISKGSFRDKYLNRLEYVYNFAKNSTMGKEFLSYDLPQISI